MFSVTTSVHSSMYTYIHDGQLHFCNCKMAWGPALPTTCKVALRIQISGSSCVMFLAGNYPDKL